MPAILLLAAAIITLALLATGIGILLKAGKTKLRRNGIITGNIMIGLAVVALGVIAAGGMGLIYVMRDTITTYFNIR